MQHTRQLAAVRDVVLETFAEYTSDNSELYETVLIRDGFYCGRCFACGEVRAVWFAEDNLVKFYGENGQFLVSQHVDDTLVQSPLDQKRRQAA